METTTRETRTLTTPAGKELVIKTYLTARERNQARDAVFAQFKFNVDGASKTAGVQDMSAQILTEGNNKLLEVAITSYDGRSDVLAALLDAPADEYDFALTEAQKTRGGDFLKAS